ncbi:MAG: tetratricopeptide repeat protein [Pirellulales bacterium]
MAALGGADAGGSAPAVSADAVFRAAAQHYAASEWQTAGDEFAQFLQQAPDHPRANQARFHYGEALVQLGKYDLARQQFDELLRRDPQHAYAKHALFRSGEAAYLAGDRAAARRQLQAFRQQYPDDAMNAYVLAHLGRVELDDHQAAAAETLFATSLSRFPQGPLADQSRLGLAEAHEDLKRLDDARRDYSQLVDAHSTLADYALVRLAAMDNDRGDHAAAIARLARVAKEYPTSVLADKATLGRGYALYKLGRYAEAEAALTPLTRRPAVAVDASYWLGMSQAARESWKEAATTFAAAVRLDERHRLNEALCYQLARALLNDGQGESAGAAFDELLRRWPGSEFADECRLGLIQIAAARGDQAETIRLADEFAAQFATSPLLPEVEAAKGRALISQGKHSEAVSALEQSLQAPAARPAAAASSPQNSKRDSARGGSQAELALSYARVGRFADALQAVQALYEQKSAAADDTCYHVAELAYAANDLPTAGTLFALLAEPQRSDDARRRGLLGQGWCQFKASQWQAAANALELYLANYPGGNAALEAALLRGRALEQLEQTDAALAMYARVIEAGASGPRAAEAMYRAARLNDKTQQRAAAIALYARLVKEHADFAEIDAALYRWAWLVRESDPATADPLFARLRQEHPSSRYVPDATLQLAERAFADKQYDEARQLADEIVGVQTPAATRQAAQYLRARVAAATNDWPQVETSLAQLIAEAPDSELALAAAFLRAEASYRRGRYAESAERLANLSAQTQARHQPWSASAELRRAQALAQIKQWHEALEVARAIASDSPDFDQQYEVDYVIGRCLAAQADLAGARAAYQQVIESPQGRDTEAAAMAQWMIGETYFHQENYSAALAEYTKVDRWQAFPRWRAAALLQRGKCHEHLGQWQDAVATYDRMLREFPQSDLTAEATRRATAARARLAQRETAKNQ